MSSLRGQIHLSAVLVAGFDIPLARDAWLACAINFLVNIVGILASLNQLDISLAS